MEPVKSDGELIDTDRIYNRIDIEACVNVAVNNTRKLLESKIYDKDSEIVILKKRIEELLEKLENDPCKQSGHMYVNLGRSFPKSDGLSKFTMFCTKCGVTIHVLIPSE